jgi:general stress protein YciG
MSVANIRERNDSQKGTCSEADCDRVASSRGRCDMHYLRWMRDHQRDGTWESVTCGRGWRGDSEGHRIAGLQGARATAERHDMAARGRIGGAAAAKDREHMAEIGRRGRESRRKERNTRNTLNKQQSDNAQDG